METPPEPAEPAAPPPTPPDPRLREEGHVPLAAMLDERDKRQALEKRLAELSGAREALARAAADPPSPGSAGRAAAVRRQPQRLAPVRRARVRQGDGRARSTSGPRTRCDADPLFNQQMRSSDDPYEAAMQAYNRERVVAEVSAGELDAFRAWKAATAPGPGGKPDPHPIIARAGPAPIPRHRSRKRLAGPCGRRGRERATPTPGSSNRR